MVRTRNIFPLVSLLIVLWLMRGGADGASAAAADALPFTHKIETFRDGDVIAFALRLEQPFLAEEFEKSNYLRLEPVGAQAYLIYPKQTTFQQKHAEFYGRLRGEGAAKVRLAYEIVSENPDGTRKVQVRQAETAVPIPPDKTGQKRLYEEWANQQNLHFAQLLRYYPEETFFQYCLLQSQARYGIAPPAIPKTAPDQAQVENDVYQMFSGSLAIQESLQRQALSGGGRGGDLNVHVSTLSPPAIKSLPYEELLEAKRVKEKVEPKVHGMARLIPSDQYFLQFNSIRALGDVLDLNAQWGSSLLRLATIQAKDQRVQGKLEDQLCVRRGPLTQLFADAVLSEFAITGADPFVQEGTDVTLIFRVKQPAAFQKAADGWLAEARQAHPDMVDAEFNYRGHKVAAHYTTDRVISAFVVAHQDYVIYSNSHRAIRLIVDVVTGAAPSLHAASDYRYVTCILPPSPAEDSGYFFVSEAMIRRLVSPAAKISEKRRVQCFNNLVMLNNASLMYRLEYGRSPGSLSDLIGGRFVDPAKIVCPHGGAYAFDAARDTCTCSLHNRLKYLTPNIELSVLNVSREEAREYDRYKQRYQAFWLGMFDPIAIRATVGPRVKLETCVLPMANGSLYNDLREAVDKNPRPLSTAKIAPSAIASVIMVRGRERIAAAIREIPGVAEALKANPTLTDLSWIGDRLSLHFCDSQSILEVDPVDLREIEVPMLGKIPAGTQSMAAAILLALKMPIYATIDIENKEHAGQLLEQLAHRVFLKENKLANLPIQLDGYRLPDYQQHAVYAFSIKVHAIKLRLHAALVGEQLVVATKPEVLREVIDAGKSVEAEPAAPAHMLVRLNRRAIHQLYDDFQLYWAEKSRAACHRNISSIYNLHKLYDTPMDQIPRLSEAKYGVRYFCPDGGGYSYEGGSDQVVCSVHGNREWPRQLPSPQRKPSFTQFIESLDEVRASLRFADDALLATVEIARSQATPAAKNPRRTDF